MCRGAVVLGLTSSVRLRSPYSVRRYRTRTCRKRQRTRKGRVDRNCPTCTRNRTMSPSTTGPRFSGPSLSGLALVGPCPSLPDPCLVCYCVQELFSKKEYINPSLPCISNKNCFLSELGFPQDPCLSLRPHTHHLAFAEIDRRLTRGSSYFHREGIKKQ